MEMNNPFQNAEELMKETRTTAEPAPAEPSAEVKEKPARKTKKERLEEVKQEIKDIREQVKGLRANKSKTEDEKRKLESLIIKSDNLKIEQAELKKDIEAEKYNAVIRQKKKKLADKKQEAIIKVLEAEGITTENDIKGLIRIRRELTKAGITGHQQLNNCLEYLKKNAPNLLNVNQ